jgi:hypothetical protein
MHCILQVHGRSLEEFERISSGYLSGLGIGNQGWKCSPHQTQANLRQNPIVALRCILIHTLIEYASVIRRYACWVSSKAFNAIYPLYSSFYFSILFL